MKSNFIKIYLSILILSLAVSCSPTKKLAPGEVFLRKNKIAIPAQVAEESELTPFLRQRENRRVLWTFKLKMWQYLSFNDSVIVAKNEKKKQRIAKKNEKRALAGKDSLSFKPVLSARLKEDGEAPVIFDSTAVKETKNQFAKALFNNGYFNNKITHQLKYNADSNKVTVIYNCVEGKRYHLKKISLVIDDPKLVSAIKTANVGSILHSGDPYDTEKIDEERVRFTSEMRNQGFYYFSKEHIEYQLDSANNNYTVNMKIHILNPNKKNMEGDSLSAQRHERYKIGEITLNTSFNPNYQDNPTDSIHFSDLTFINLSRLKYNPHAFTNKLFFSSGDYFSEKDQARTYTRLSGLNNFKYINISFSPSESDSNTLNCNIIMTPFQSQSVGVEVEGTNTSGNLGVSGYLNYTHRNLFGNAEHLKVRVKGGMEAQVTNSASNENPDNALNIFNTIEYGTETSLTFQDLILPGAWRDKILKKFNRPKTSLNLVLNYQNRPDFERFLTNASIGYVFTRKTKSLNEFFIYPIDVSFIRINKSQAFTDRLNDLNNPLLDATYANQFIAGVRVIEAWTNKQTTTQDNYILNRLQVETAGNGLHLANTLFGSDQETNADGESYYTIGEVRYAQFFKVQNDINVNNRINRGQAMAYRLLGGIGVPYGNAAALPYDRSFFGGGANDMRGWRARSLGPGSMIDSLKVGVDQVADIKIQFGIEYRFNIFKAMEGAAFVDAGNIWLLREDPNRPNAHFDISRFYKEIAVSVGTGLRLNFGFLLVRLDWGLKIYDPALPLGQRLVLDRGDYLKNYNAYTNGKSYNYSVFNLGIGYPF